MATLNYDDEPEVEVTKKLPLKPQSQQLDETIMQDTDTNINIPVVPGLSLLHSGPTEPSLDPPIPKPFQFHGAGDRNHEAPPSHDFTFSKPPPKALPEYDSYRPERSDRYDDRRDRNRNHGRGDRRGGRGGRGNGDRERPPRPVQAAHDRPILRLSGREKTPEQYPAMVQKQPVLVEDEEMEMELDSDLGEDVHSETNEDEHQVKRVKMDLVVCEQPEETATKAETEVEPLPGKKNDFINIIRSLKESVNITKRDTVSNNDDFISFGGSDGEASDAEVDMIGKAMDEANEEKRKEISSILGKNVPTGPAFSHREFHQGLQSPRPQSNAKPNGKRTHSDFEASSGDPGALQYEMRGDGSLKDTPWVQQETSHKKSLYPAVWLHKEILDFYDFIKPQPYEHLVRHDLVNRIRNLVQKLYSDADIRSFGSFASKLYLPTSDMDLVLVSQSFARAGPPKYHTKKAIYNVANLMIHNKICDKHRMQIIASARVPIIKFVDKATGLHVDISFENLGGIVAIDTFKQWKEIYPDMPKIVMVIKHFLAQRMMNDPSQGGLGSFSVVCLTVSLLQLMPEASSGNWNSNENVSLGRLLMEFLLLYGKKFNTTMVGIQVDKPGYFKKTSIQRFFNSSKPQLLCIMDPNNPENDVSKASYRIKDIFRAFANAYDTLEEQIARTHWSSFEQRHSSLLRGVLGGNYDHVFAQRDAMKETFLARGLGTKEDLDAWTKGDLPDDDDVLIGHHRLGEVNLIRRVEEKKEKFFSVRTHGGRRQGENVRDGNNPWDEVVSDINDEPEDALLADRMSMRDISSQSSKVYTKKNRADKYAIEKEKRRIKRQGKAQANAPDRDARWSGRNVDDDGAAALQANNGETMTRKKNKKNKKGKNTPGANSMNGGDGDNTATAEGDAPSTSATSGKEKKKKDKKKKKNKASKTSGDVVVNMNEPIDLT